MAARVCRGADEVRNLAQRRRSAANETATADQATPSERVKKGTGMLNSQHRAELAKVK
jgi:hypothetical protein